MPNTHQIDKFQMIDYTVIAGFIVSGTPYIASETGLL